MRELTASERSTLFWAVQERLQRDPVDFNDDGQTMRAAMMALLRRAAGAILALPRPPAEKRIFALRQVLPGSTATAASVGEEVAAARLKGGVPMTSSGPDESLRAFLASGAGSIDLGLRATVDDLDVAVIVTELAPLLLPEDVRRTHFSAAWLVAEGLGHTRAGAVLGVTKQETNRRTRLALGMMSLGLLRLFPDIFTLSEAPHGAR